MEGVTFSVRAEKGQVVPWSYRFLGRGSGLFLETWLGCGKPSLQKVGHDLGVGRMETGNRAAVLNLENCFVGDKMGGSFQNTLMDWRVAR